MRTGLILRIENVFTGGNKQEKKLGCTSAADFYIVIIIPTIIPTIISIRLWLHRGHLERSNEVAYSLNCWSKVELFVDVQ